MTKKKKEPNTIVFYHGKCTDGFTAAWAAWKSLKGKAEYVPLRHGAEIPNYPACVKGKNVFFLDFCPSEETLLEIQSMAKSLQVLDHHKTMQDQCGHLEFCKFEMNKSGAGMAWDHFCRAEKGPSLLVDYVEDRDIWKNCLFETEAINLVVFSTDFSFENWDELNYQLSEGVDAILEKGNTLKAYKRRILDGAKLNVQRMQFLGHEDVPVVNFSSFLVSDILDELCEDAEFAVSWHVGSTKEIHYSLRSRGEFDVAKLVEPLGGGGHKNAAAFRSRVVLFAVSE